MELLTVKNNRIEWAVDPRGVDARERKILQAFLKFVNRKLAESQDSATLTEKDLLGLRTGIVIETKIAFPIVSKTLSSRISSIVEALAANNADGTIVANPPVVHDPEEAERNLIDLQFLHAVDETDESGMRNLMGLDLPPIPQPQPFTHDPEEAARNLIDLTFLRAAEEAGEDGMRNLMGLDLPPLPQAAPVVYTPEKAADSLIDWQFLHAAEQNGGNGMRNLMGLPLRSLARKPKADKAPTGSVSRGKSSGNGATAPDPDSSSNHFYTSPRSAELDRWGGRTYLRADIHDIPTNPAAFMAKAKEIATLQNKCNQAADPKAAARKPITTPVVTPQKKLDYENIKKGLEEIQIGCIQAALAGAPGRVPAELPNTLLACAFAPREWSHNFEFIEAAAAAFMANPAMCGSSLSLSARKRALRTADVLPPNLKIEAESIIGDWQFPKAERAAAAAALARVRAIYPDAKPEGSFS